MAGSQRDLWAEWLLKRRFGGNADAMKAALDYLCRARDKVLINANWGENQVLLDVGCGDGLIGFGALEKTTTSRVIFTDISEDLLNHTQIIARDMGVLERCEFILTSAEALSSIGNESADVVTTRSVLIYVLKKRKAFTEFYRVLKPGGRLSIFEPINAFGHPEPPHIFAGQDVTPIVGIARKMKDVYERIQPLGQDPMFDFDERTLLEYAKEGGFNEIHLELQAEIVPMNRDEFTSRMNWETFLHVAGNPKIPTVEEAMGEALSSDEKEIFIAHMRPLVEAKQGVVRKAVSYLWAVK